MAEDGSHPLKTTPLTALHKELGARMVPFAGYEMPVQFPLGVMGEHRHTRAAAGLFDVSHMGQIHVDGPNAAIALERLVPQSVASLASGRQRYVFFTTPTGGIFDDAMVARLEGDGLYLVVNASRKADDLARLAEGLPDQAVEAITDRALLALQGPKAAASLAALVPGVESMAFMDHRRLDSAFGSLWISRSGYTGEDGFEISVATEAAERLARALLDLPAVAPVGLGARDSLRLEAGLCLYGSDIDTTTSPISAGLTWAIQKVRRLGGARAGGFPGTDPILRELTEGPARLRVGLLPDGRAPMRAGTPLFATKDDVEPMGTVTSGAFGPSIERPVSMGYMPSTCAAVGSKVYGEVRGKRLPATVTDLPFHPHSYKR